MKKIIPALMVLLTLLTSVSFAIEFSDVDYSKYGKVFETAMNDLNKKGAITGYPDGTFKPTALISRAEISKIICTAFDINVKENGESKFSDVKTNSWYFKYVSTAAEKGIIKGYEDGTFRPNDSITYGELATILVRLANVEIKESDSAKDWVTPYWNAASKINMFDNYFANDLIPSNKARRDGVVLLTFNTLNYNPEEVQKPEKEEKEDEKEPALIADRLYIGVVTTKINESGKDYVEVDCFKDGVYKLQVINLNSMPKFGSLLFFKAKTSGRITLKRELKLSEVNHNFLEVEEVDEPDVVFKGLDKFLDLEDAVFEYNGEKLNLKKYTFYSINMDLDSNDEYEYTGAEEVSLDAGIFKKEDRVLIDKSNKMIMIIRGIDSED